MRLSLAVPVVVLAMVACSNPPHASTPAPTVLPTNAPAAAAGPESPAQLIAQAVDNGPYPYGAPLPPAVYSPVDGVYTKTVPFEGTPTPCRRCAEYRLEGGEWILSLDKGTFKVFHPGTGFKAVGSFTLSGDHLTLFNDPNCEDDLTTVGSYTWALNGTSLTLKEVNDTCFIRLRAKNLTSSEWTRVGRVFEQSKDPCQPPNREAAVSGHWAKPASCGE
jgi:hypothetical protein